MLLLKKFKFPPQNRRRGDAIGKSCTQGQSTGHNQRIIPVEEGWNDEINHCQPIVGAPIMSLRHVVDMKKEILLQV
jgi:hypothetical protein